MPSPLGHALGAAAAGWLGQRPPAARRALLVQAGVLAALGVAPDLDLLIHRHRAETHSIGAALIVATLAAWWRWPIAAQRGRIWLAAFLAWVSHPVLDVLAADSSRPFGVMFCWPFTTRFVHAGWTLFAGTQRDWREADFWTHNLTAARWEVVCLLPVAVGVWLIRRQR